MLICTSKEGDYMRNKNNTFGERLKKLRTDNHISQSELAGYLEITPSSLSYYENGSRIPTIRILGKLAERFNVSTAWLLGVENEESIELKTYADMINIIILLIECSNVWSLWLEPLPFDDDKIKGLATNDSIILDFLSDYKKMTDLTDKSPVPKDLFKTWIDGRLQNLKNMPLPETDPDEQ